MRHVVRFDSRHHVSGICVELTRMMLSIDERDLKAKLNEHNSLIGVGSIGDGIANLIAGIFLYSHGMDDRRSDYALEGGVHGMRIGNRRHGCGCDSFQKTHRIETI